MIIRKNGKSNMTMNKICGEKFEQNAISGCKFHENCYCLEDLSFEQRLKCCGECVIHEAVRHDQMMEEDLKKDKEVCEMTDALGY